LAALREILFVVMNVTAARASVWFCAVFLAATAAGAAFLPVEPELGHVYRISVTIHVSDWSWAAVGLSQKAAPARPET
jgi:hypothetical protein